MLSPIVGEDLIGLPSPVVVALPRMELKDSRAHGVYWDTASDSWRDNGCVTSPDPVAQPNHNLTVFKCDGIADFALLQVT